MTAKVFIENQLVKTLYLQRGKLSEAMITQRVDELYRDIERIGLDFLIEIVDKPKKLLSYEPKNKKHETRTTVTIFR